MTDQPEEKKIYVDEDWKSRVEAEREAAAKPREEASTQKTAGITWPEPSLILLATTLATQAMVALGVVPHPGTGKPALDLAQAKHFIDTLGMLQEKTEGNRSAEETAMLENTVHELRMAYVAVQGQQGTAGA